MNPYHPQNRPSLWLFSLNARGERLSEQSVGSFSRDDVDAGLGIAANADGDLFVTGQLMGTPLFGTNVMGDGPSGIANAFVARRALPHA